MDAVQWDLTTDVRALLDAARATTSVRKRQLFTCAVCRRLLPLLAGEVGRWAEDVRTALEGAERYADSARLSDDIGHLWDAQMSELETWLWRPDSLPWIPLTHEHQDWQPSRFDMPAEFSWVRGVDFHDVLTRATQTAVWWASRSEVEYDEGWTWVDGWHPDALAASAAADARAAASVLATRTFPGQWTDLNRWDTPWEHEQQRQLEVRYQAEAWGTARASEVAAQAALCRDVFGNPFRPTSVDPAWRTETVRHLGQQAYDERHLPDGSLDAPRLAVLADALEETGCQNAALLDHLRQQQTHVRGCWALDLLLGRG